MLVAVTTSYLGRTGELRRERDYQMRTIADLAADQLRSVVQSVDVATAIGVDAATTKDALVAANPQLGLCVADATAIECGGESAFPSRASLENLQARLAGGGAPTTDIEIYDAVATIESIGPNLVASVRVPAGGYGNDEITVWVTTDVPTGTEVEGFVVEQGVRQTATAVSGVDRVYVAVAADENVSLPTGERRLDATLFAIAVALLFIATVTIIIEHRNLLERASIDQLTKLPNRGEFQDRGNEAVAEAIRTGEPLALMLFDLDDFKYVNDTYGHQTGDELLEAVAQRLRRAVRNHEIVARWGGDEFTVIMPNIGSADVAARRATEVVEAVGGRTRLPSTDEAIRLHLSAGVAMLPDNAPDLNGLIRAADEAMYQAKRSGSGTAVAKVGRARAFVEEPAQASS